MQKVVIREETSADFAEVYHLNVAAFEQANEAKLVDLLRQSEAFIPGLSLVAVHEDKIAGHILFTRIKIRNGDKVYESLALAPMAVQPRLQRMGIGGQLIRYGLDRVRELGYQFVIVLGHERYYPKFGFVPAEKWKIRAPFDVPSKVFMAIELVKDGLKNISGMAEYPQEFSMV